jgi:hypothetical protein
MTTITATENSFRNDDDLSNLCRELKQDIETRKYMIATDVTQSLDEVSRWFERKQNQDLAGHCTMILQNIQLAKKNVMVSSCIYVPLRF